MNEKIQWGRGGWHNQDEIGSSGKWQTFRIYYDGVSGSKNEAGPWILSTSLPGIKSELGHFKDIETAKAKAEFLWKYWLEKAGK